MLQGMTIAVAVLSVGVATLAYMDDSVLPAFNSFDKAVEKLCEDVDGMVFACKTLSEPMVFSSCGLGDVEDMIERMEPTHSGGHEPE